MNQVSYHQPQQQQGYTSTVLPGQPPKQPLNVLNVLFLTGTALSAINCFARADYNLPVFLFAYLMWDQDVNRDQAQRIRILYLLMFSTFVDFYYIIYWGSSLGAYSGNLDWLSSVYIFTIVMASILMVLKFITIIRATSSDPILQDNVSVQGITHNLTSFFSSDPYGSVSQHQQLQVQQQQLQQQQVNYNSNPQYQQNVYGNDSQNLNKPYKI